MSKLWYIHTVDIAVKINEIDLHIFHGRISQIWCWIKEQVADKCVQYDDIYIQVKNCKYYCCVGNYVAATEAC